MKREIGTLFLLLLFVFPQAAHGATITVSDGNPQTITSEDQEYHTTVTLSIHADDGTSYHLGGLFNRAGTTNYCGKTWNPTSSSWVGYTDWEQLPTMTISSSSGTMTIKAKLDTADSGCQATGEYRFKIRRYTKSGSASSSDDQNEQTITVALPTITPTMTRTPAPTRTPSPHPTAPQVTTLTPPRTPTKTPTTVRIQQASGPTPTEEPMTPVDETEKKARLAAPTTQSATAASQVLGASDRTNQAGPLVWYLITGGAISLGVAGYSAYTTSRKKGSGVP